MTEMGESLSFNDERRIQRVELHPTRVYLSGTTRPTRLCFLISVDKGTIMLTNSDIVHRLLYHALIDIRGQASETSDKVAFHLADLFHNVVLDMGRSASGNGDYSVILKEIRRRAKEKGCERWVDQQMKAIREGDE